MAKTTTKSYAILRKNVGEVENKLTILLSFPPETPAPNILVREFETHLAFAANLLSAELASRGPSRGHIRHIAHRLDHLRAIFRAWSRGAPPSELLLADDASACSSCLDGDPEPEGLAIVAYRGEPAPLKEEEEGEFEECLVADVGEEERSGLLSRVGVRKNNNKIVLVFSLVLILVAVVIIVVLCFYCRFDYYGDYDANSLTPT